MAWWEKIDVFITEVAASERALAKLLVSTILLAAVVGLIFAGYKGVAYFLIHKPWWFKFIGL